MFLLPPTPLDAQYRGRGRGRPRRSTQISLERIKSEEDVRDTCWVNANKMYDVVDSNLDEYTCSICTYPPLALMPHDERVIVDHSNPPLQCNNYKCPAILCSLCWKRNKEMYNDRNEDGNKILKCPCCQVPNVACQPAYETLKALMQKQVKCTTCGLRVSLGVMLSKEGHDCIVPSKVETEKKSHTLSHSSLSVTNLNDSVCRLSESVLRNIGELVNSSNEKIAKEENPSRKKKKTMGYKFALNTILNVTQTVKNIQDEDTHGINCHLSFLNNGY